MRHLADPEPSIERLYEARERRRREQEQLRERLRNASSIGEYLEIKLASEKPEPQQTANRGYEELKTRR